MRALTAVCVRLRLTAALTKLPVLTTSRNVRATLISIDQYLSGKAAIIFICLLTITGRSFLGKTESARSEENTSELQSLMRISYAVFCLKQQTTTNLNRLLLLTH